MSQRRFVDFTPGRPRPPRWNTGKLTGKARSQWVRALGRDDQVVAWYKPYVRPSWMTAEEHEVLPETLTIRECRYRVDHPGFRVREVTLATTLLDAALYPVGELAGLYASRWRVETDFAHLKTTLGMDVLHCKTEAGVLKELAAFAIVYNLVRLVMLEASRRQGVAVDRVSFVDALRWLASSPPGAALPGLIVNPHRPGAVGTALQEAAREEASLHDPPSERAAATPPGATSSGLTSWHSGRTLFIDDHFHLPKPQAALGPTGEGRYMMSDFSKPNRCSSESRPSGTNSLIRPSSNSTRVPQGISTQRAASWPSGRASSRGEPPDTSPYGDAYAPRPERRSGGRKSLV